MRTTPMRSLPTLWVPMLLAATCGPSGRAADAAKGSPAWSLDRARLAFTSDREGNAEIYVRRPEGGLTNLTRHPAQDHWASWSPDGSRIAFQSLRDGNREIYVMQSDGSDPVNLSNHPDEDLLPAWSPDGTRIAFFSTRDYARGPQGEFRGAIYVMHVDGSHQQRMTREMLTTSEAMSWSPDGSRILFSREVDGQGEIFALGLDDSAETRLTTSATSEGAPVFSPDGSMIACDQQAGDTARIALMRADGSGMRPLTRGPQDYYPSWSPDGSTIAFTTFRDGSLEIVAIRVDGSGEVRITNHPADDRKAEWAPSR
jgi:Tol biopolymer transport system component